MSLEAPFVGRARELAALVERVEGLVASGRGGLVAVEGEPGIGKTRLVDEACERARERGVRIARGAALADAGAPSLAPWRAIARAAGPEARRVLEGRSRDAEEPPTEARWQRYSAFADAVAAVAERTPLVVVLDDAHDADVESLELLAFVARDLRDARVLVLATLRDRTTRDAGAREATLVRVLRDASVLRLAPLGEPEIRAMARHAGQDGLAPRVLASSRGNPLFAVELLSLARAGADVSSTRVPESIAAALRARLGTLGEAERESLDLAAVLGADVRLPLLARALDRSLEAAMGSLQRPIRMGVLDDDGSLRLRFAHPLFRETILGDLPADRRRRLHARLAAALRDALAAGIEVAAAEVAHHLAESLPHGDAGDVLAWLARAASEAAAALSYEEVAALAVRSAEVAAAAGLPVGRRCDLELDAARALSRAGARQRASEAAARAAALARSADDPERLARAALARGADFSIGVVDAGLVQDLRASREALGARAPSLAARLDARLAAALQPASDPSGPVALGRAALAGARALHDREALLEVMMSVGSAYADYAPVDERRALAEEMVALASELGRTPIALRGTLRLAIDAIEARDLAGADAAIDEHRRLAASLGAPHYRWTVPVLVAMRAAMRGAWPVVQACHAEARALAERAEDPNALVTLALQYALSGTEWLDGAAFDAAWDAVDRATRGLRMPPWTRQCLEAQAHARRGDRERARAALDAVQLDHPMLLADDCVGGSVAEAYALVRPERAGDFLARAERLAERDAVWGPVACVWDGPWARRLGLLRRATGELDLAIAALEAGRDRCAVLGARALACRTSVELAETLERRGGSGDAARADVLRDEAGREADALGMVFCAAQARSRPSDVRTPPSSARGTVPSAIAFTLALDGETYRLAREGRVHHLKDSRGLRMLARLIEEPDRDFHVLELAGAEGADAGDAGEVVDARAIAAYRGRVTELRQALEEAEADGDLGRIEPARAELDALMTEIARSVGLGGRSRRAAGAVERARVNVQRRLRDAQGRIAALDPELGAHLEWALRTGVLCRYRTR